MVEPVLVGRVAKAHGILGEVSVELLTDLPERFSVGAVVFNGETPLTVEGSRPHQGRVLVKFREVPDRNAAEALRGAQLSIPEADIAPLPEGKFYPHQLEGAAVQHADGTPLGSFARVERSPAHDIWVVTVGQREVLVPAVKEFVRSVDLGARLIVLDPPEGLF